MLVKPVLVGALETALNKYLALDADASLFLKPLAGKVVAFKLMPLDWVIYLCPTEDSIQILEHYQGQPDTVLTGSVGALAMMGLSANPMRSIFSGDVKIAGDMETGKRFQRLFEQLDPDFEEVLSNFTGDVIAHKTGQVFRAGHAWGRETLNTLQMNTSEFLQDETHDLPPQPEVDIFFKKVDELRSDFDRLDARIKRLQQS
mgnify:CR=1 FL=1